MDFSGKISYSLTRHLLVEIGFDHTQIDSDFSVHFNHQDIFRAVIPGIAAMVD